ncbi:Stk1 family PASTA domain-containing Ser/Thr kinase [Georgenia halophila]|uniref:non-specific serine/threonine protein kinase n=1 Tax=Georgenia halophila TaxID=620889 RepID=A0ABP8LNJ7_9MICO
MDTTTLDPMIGRLVDERYEVTSRIARGGMATVYRATDRRLERTVAVKVMHPHLAESPDFVARFRREARAAARLTHPGVVAVHDQGTAGDASYLTMELVDGPNLRAILRRRGSLPLGEALQTTEQVLDALASAHRAGLVHRDIKPENVLLTTEGRAKVADFGLARAVTEATAATTGTVLGTVAYLAPEIVTEGSADPRSDVYAVGVLLYELVTGHQPFTGEAPIQVAFQHVNGRIPSPSGRVPWLPAEVDELVGALTAREIEERPADAAAALALVRRCLATLDADTLARRADVPPAAPAPSADGAHGPDEDDGDRTGALSPHRTAAVEAVPSHGTVALPIGAITNEQQAAAAAARPPRRRAWPRVLALLLVLLVAAGAAAVWWFQVGPGATVPAPDVVGLEQDAAIDQVEAAGLSARVERDHHDEVPAGVVISTDPAPGVAVHQDGSVRVLVSQGVLMIDVPDVAGDPADEATAAIEESGLAVGETTEEFHDTVPEGAVVSTSPGAGESVRHDSSVDLVTSKGREPVDVPDVTGEPRAEAIGLLEQAGLTVGDQTEQHHENVPEGSVIALSPAPGEQLYRGDAVDVVVSLGPELHEVPSVVGQQVGAARSTLEDAGFDVEVDEVLGGYFGTVRSQDPSGGEMRPRGTVITLTVV